MSRSLRIECERVAEPAASDPLERQTWAALRIYADQRCVTRMLDRATGRETDTIYIPLFPLAQWVVRNWWALLNESCRWENPPGSGRRWSPEMCAWMKRHSIRSAESGLLLPRMCLYGDGRNICVDWSRDEDDAYPNMPGQFLYSSRVLLDRPGVEVALGDFVTRILSWLDAEADPRLTRMIENWEAISSSDPGEAAFCDAAGRLGLDPYGEIAGPVLDLLEHAGEEPGEQDLFGDVLDAARAEQSPALWQWASGLGRKLNLDKAPPLDVPGLATYLRPANAGYQAARQWRARLSLDPSRPAGDLSGLCSRMGMPEVRSEEHNHVPAGMVRAAVGWKTGRSPILAGPSPENEQNRRFLQARGIFQLAYGCVSGPRLVTDAHSWDQQCSRAFAAELLIPQEIVLAELGGVSDPDEADQREADLSQRYNVSSRAVRHQLYNSLRLV